MPTPLPFKTSLSLLLRLAVICAGSAALVSTGCARNATGCTSTSTSGGSGVTNANCPFISPRIYFKFSTQGTLALNNPNIAYYLVLNAPDDKAGQTIDPLTSGPRFNGPDINFPATELRGRLPFLGLVTGDTASVWTDFYYIQGNASGAPIVRRGRLLNGQPFLEPQPVATTLYSPNTPNASTQTFELQIVLSDVLEDAQNLKPKNFTANLGVSDNPDSGQGGVYDAWLSNVPFSIQTDLTTTPQTVLDNNTNLYLRQIFGRPVTQLPTGVDPGSVNLVSYEYQVRLPS